MENNSFKIAIKKENYIYNIKYLEKMKNKKVLPVLKANAYGHGLEVIAPLLYENGYKDYVVARLTEGENLYSVLEKEDVKIIVLESIKSLQKVKENSWLIMAINKYEELIEAIEFGISPIQMKLKFDFGFGRNGIVAEDFSKVISYIKEKDLKFFGIYTHLFSVDQKFGIEIINRFTEIVNELGKERFVQIDLQNSMGIFKFDCPIATHIRPGIAMYGLREEGYYEPQLRQVFKLIGGIAEIRNVKTLSKYIAYAPINDCDLGGYTNIAKVKIGYGDGFLKKNEGSKCIINNKEFKIIQISMDNSFIAVDENVVIGDEVNLYSDIWKSGNELEIKTTELVILVDRRIERVGE